MAPMCKLLPCCTYLTLADTYAHTDHFLTGTPHYLMKFPLLGERSRDFF